MMATQVKHDHDIAIYQKGRKKGLDHWFVDVTCNVLLTRTYGPFPSKEEALRFLEGAELELRKLLDFELRLKSGRYSLGIPERDKLGG
ncbi:MAG: hypothetical protein OEZ57_12360 [Nitrospirota bacterium]|nr:hypothetical protein [Nitrospirota bacterium]MDH5585468.1 hypothetical protein [Nitrospirota bacterium]MDH5775696.1 hypothetical protein [Nitrospirota bacterium]